MLEQREKLRKESLSKKEPGSDDFGNSQTVRIAKVAKIRRFTVMKVCLRGKVKVWLETILPMLKRLSMSKEVQQLGEGRNIGEKNSTLVWELHEVVQHYRS